MPVWDDAAAQQSAEEDWNPNPKPNSNPGPNPNPNSNSNQVGRGGLER